MQRETIIDHLAMAERHVAEGYGRIHEQRDMIDRLRTEGHDIATAEGLLSEMQELQTARIADRDRLRGLLDEAV
jgi:hypothetical protein